MAIPSCCAGAARRLVVSRPSLKFVVRAAAGGVSATAAAAPTAVARIVRSRRLDRARRRLFVDEDLKRAHLGGLCTARGDRDLALVVAREREGKLRLLRAPRLAVFTADDRITA